MSIMRPASANRASRRSLEESFNISIPHERAHTAYSDGYPSPTKTDYTAQSEMLDTKFGRKRAETELQLLANRIALLKLEEQRALQKVNETRSRAEEILENKRRNYNNTEMKIRQQRQREEEIRAIREKAIQEREERRAKAFMNKKVISETRKANADNKKEESKRLSQMLSTGKAYSEFEKRQRAEEEKKRREFLRVQREQEKIEREQQIKYQHQLRLEEELRKKQEAEEMIDLLAREELELRKRIKRTESMQVEAYSVLQRSLNA